MEFSRQEYWSGLPFPTLEDLLIQGLNLCFWCLLHGQADSLPTVPHYFCLTNFSSLSILPTQDTVSAKCTRTPLMQIQWSSLLLSCSTSRQSPLAVIQAPFLALLIFLCHMATISQSSLLRFSPFLLTFVSEYPNLIQVLISSLTLFILRKSISPCPLALHAIYMSMTAEVLALSLISLLNSKPIYQTFSMASSFRFLMGIITQYG